MSERGDGNYSTHGTAGKEGADAGQKVADFFKGGNKLGEEIRGNVNSFADNAFQKPSSATGNEASAATTGGTQATTQRDPVATTTASGQPAHESTGFSGDAKALGNAVKDAINKHS